MPGLLSFVTAARGKQILCTAQDDRLSKRGLVEEHGAVERVALNGFESGVANDAAQLFFCGAVGSTGCFHDVLFQHDRADVIAAEAQTKLEDFQSLRDPAGLHVFDV